MKFFGQKNNSAKERETEIGDNQKRRKALMRKLKVKRGAVEEDVMYAIVEYAKNGGVVALEQLSEAEQSNAQFMLRLYATAGFSTNIVPPQQLQGDEEFMVKFFKLFVQEEKERQKHYRVRDVEWPLRSYVKTISNPSFLEKLHRSVPSIDILKLLNNALNNCGVKRNPEKFEEVCNALSCQLLFDQAMEYGSNFLSLLPKSNPNYVEAVGRAVLRDGFASLCYLEKEDILANKHLILSATECKRHGGALGLKNYISQTLSPRRTLHDASQGENVFDLDYYEIQKALLLDKAFWKKAGELIGEEEKKNFKIPLCRFGNGAEIEVFENLEAQPCKPEAARTNNELKK